MRPIARQSARVANGQRLRAASRSPCVQQRRAFQAGASRLSDQRPPGDPSYSQKLDEALSRPTERSLRNDLEGGAETRRPGYRRSFRQRKVAEVPPPPPLPEWFLKYNVFLVPEEAGQGDGENGSRQLRCVDAQTGHTLFHVPYYPDEAHEEKAKAELEEDAKKQQEEQAKKASIPGISMLGDDFFQQKFGGQIPPVLETGNDLPLGFKVSHRDEFSRYDPFSWTMLETEVSARAAMGLSGTAEASSSHAASRSDIHLHCPDSNAHDQMDQYVREIARVLQADHIRLDANDIADLTSDYVGEGSDLPGSFSTLGYDVYDGASATGLGIRGVSPTDHPEPVEFDEEEGEEEGADPAMNLGGLGGQFGSYFGSLDDLRKALGDKRHDLNKTLGRFGVAGVSVGMPQGASPFPQPTQQPAQDKRSSEPSDYVSWDDARLVAVLESLLNAPSAAKGANLEKPAESADAQREANSSVNDQKAPGELPWSTRAGSMVADVVKLFGHRDKAPATGDASSSPIRLDTAEGVDGQHRSGKRTIVQIRDLKQILAHRLGESIVKRLVRVVQKRRRAGEEVLVIGTSAAEVEGPLDSLLDTYEDSPFRLIVVPPLFDMSAMERRSFNESMLPAPTRSIYQAPSYDRIANINLRHISSMLNRLGARNVSSIDFEQTFKKLHIPGTHILSEKTLPQDQIQRLVLTAIGLSKSHAKAETVTPVHVALATAILAKADHAVHSWTSFRDAQHFSNTGVGKNLRDLRAGKHAPGEGASEKTPGQSRIEGIKKKCNQHETRLLAGVVDPQNIKTGFEDVHASPESIEALKSMTTLSLLRPDAFEYGVLANDRLTGLLLYGPPGTGKTLLAKAVAKESGATVLEVSGAQIYEKYVGEGEKMVRAVFSLAKKLSPCVVFIDEADAIFGSRGGSGNRNTHREIINQFLREWDGMDDNSVFMMVASNRPFDLDDAVLRRLPRRLLIDLPIAKDRESILGIHLRNEALDESVNLATLSEQTPLYSGSDLKNLCVSAALAAVREENELAEQHKGDNEFKLPEKRTLNVKHFDKAVAEISASINEDMSSLTAIRKFDEQFGDRRGRKKKSGYGFGTGDDSVDENAARVRSGP